MSTTVVTALYDIGREQKGDGRRFSTYLQWFERTLQLNAPMVVFVDEKLQDFVLSHRPKGHQTLVIKMPLDQIPAWRFLPRIRELLNEGGPFHKQIRAPKDLTFRQAEYVAVVFSKFGWLLTAMERNPFKTETFVWLDAGASRFWTKDFDPSSPWPHSSWVEHFGAHRSRAYIQAWSSMWPYLAGRDRMSARSLIGTSKAHLVTGVFGGHQRGMKRYCQRALRFLERDMLDRKRVDNEQVATELLWQRHTDEFGFIIVQNMRNLWGWIPFPILMDTWRRPKDELEPNGGVLVEPKPCQTPTKPKPKPQKPAQLKQAQIKPSQIKTTLAPTLSHSTTKGFS